MQISKILCLFACLLAPHAAIAKDRVTREPGGAHPLVKASEGAAQQLAASERSLQEAERRLAEAMGALPARLRYLKNQLSDTMSKWRSSTEATCQLLAELRYPLEPAQAGRANDLEKSIAAASCSKERNERRTALLNQMRTNLPVLLDEFKDDW